MRMPLGVPSAQDPAEALVRRSVAWQPPRLPGLTPGTVRRWKGTATWQPPESVILSRHRAVDRPHWIVTNGRDAPDGYELEFDLGLVQRHEQPGTRRLVASQGSFVLADGRRAAPAGRPRAGPRRAVPVPADGPARAAARARDGPARARVRRRGPAVRDHGGGRAAGPPGVLPDPAPPAGPQAPAALEPHAARAQDRTRPLAPHVRLGRVRRARPGRPDDARAGSRCGRVRLPASCRSGATPTAASRATCTLPGPAPRAIRPARSRAGSRRRSCGRGGRARGRCVPRHRVLATSPQKP